MQHKLGSSMRPLDLTRVSSYPTCKAHVTVWAGVGGVYTCKCVEDQGLRQQEGWAQIPFLPLPVTGLPLPSRKHFLCWYQNKICGISQK